MSKNRLDLSDSDVLIKLFSNQLKNVIANIVTGFGERTFAIYDVTEVEIIARDLNMPRISSFLSSSNLDNFESIVNIGIYEDHDDGIDFTSPVLLGYDILYMFYSSFQNEVYKSGIKEQMELFDEIRKLL